MHDVITIGSATRDVFVKSAALEVHHSDHSASSLEACFPLGPKIEIDDLVVETGGGASNAAVTFTRLGWKTALIAALGDDHPSDEVLRHLKTEKIDVRFMQKIKNGRTGMSIILLAGTGERTILVYRGAAGTFNKKIFPFAKLRAKWLYVTSLGGDLALMRHILTAAEKTKTKVAWNPGMKEITHGLKALTPLLKKIDVLNLNKEEAAALAGTDPQNFAHIIRTLRPLPRRALIVTDGMNGTYAADTHGEWHSGIIDVPRVNFTGAGDAFGSGLIAGLLKKDDLPYALAIATWNATGVVQQMGAKRGIMHAYPSAIAIKKVPIKKWSDK